MKNGISLCLWLFYCRKKIKNFYSLFENVYGFTDRMEKNKNYQVTKSIYSCTLAIVYEIVTFLSQPPMRCYPIYSKLSEYFANKFLSSHTFFLNYQIRN